MNSINARRGLAQIAGILLLGAAIGAAAMCGYQSYEHAQQREQQQTTDIPFLQHMAVHHDQALTLATMMMNKAQGPVRQLAQSVLAQQRVEIGMFRGWLMQWQQPLLPPRISMDWMSHGLTQDDIEFVSMCRATPGGMAGMATMDELNQLMTQDAAAANRLFLVLLKKHHEGALPMLRYASRQASNEAVRQLAAAMALEQRNEIMQINALLGRL